MRGVTIIDGPAITISDGTGSAEPPSAAMMTYGLCSPDRVQTPTTATTSSYGFFSTALSSPKLVISTSTPGELAQTPKLRRYTPGVATFVKSTSIVDGRGDVSSVHFNPVHGILNCIRWLAMIGISTPRPDSRCLPVLGSTCAEMRCWRPSDGFFGLSTKCGTSQSTPSRSERLVTSKSSSLRSTLTSHRAGTTSPPKATIAALLTETRMVIQPI